MEIAFCTLLEHEIYIGLRENNGAIHSITIISCWRDLRLFLNKHFPKDTVVAALHVIRMHRTLRMPRGRFIAPQVFTGIMAEALWTVLSDLQHHRHDRAPGTTLRPQVHSVFRGGTQSLVGLVVWEEYPEFITRRFARNRAAVIPTRCVWVGMFTCKQGLDELLGFMHADRVPLIECRRVQHHFSGRGYPSYSNERPRILGGDLPQQLSWCNMRTFTPLCDLEDP